MSGYVAMSNIKYTLGTRAIQTMKILFIITDSKVHGANMGPTWVLSAPDGPHVGPMNLAIRAGWFQGHRFTIIPRQPNPRPHLTDSLPRHIQVPGWRQMVRGPRPINQVWCAYEYVTNQTPSITLFGSNSVVSAVSPCQPWTIKTKCLHSVSKL